MKFNFNTITAIINSIVGVYDAKEGEFIGSCFEWKFNCAGDITIGRLKPDLETISLSGRGVAGLRMAFEIQMLYKDPIRITNADYSFDLNMAGYATFEELKTAIGDNG